MRNLEGGDRAGLRRGSARRANPWWSIPAARSPKSDQDHAARIRDAGTPKPGAGAAIIEILSGTPQTESGKPISTIETIRIADAEIRFYDEANDAIWNIPAAELVFQRMPYGFAVAANAAVSNGDEAGQLDTPTSPPATAATRAASRSAHGSTIWSPPTSRMRSSRSRSWPASRFRWRARWRWR